MNIKVNSHTLEINQNMDINAGEYNITTLNFEFSDEYEGLTKVAVFSLCDGTTKNVTILNNQCIIPVECLQETGQVQIGVYGYATQDNELVLRYSPTPQNFVVRLGSYKEGTQPVAPTPTDWEILVEQVSDIAEDVSSIHEDITGINGEISGINIDIRDLQDTKANISDLAEVAFTGEFSDLKNIPSYATTQQLNQEKQDRQDADVNLQSQIDAISASSDVVDVVGTYQELLDYDTTHLKDNDIVKVLQDSTHSDALSYYRWDKETSTWSYVGSEGPFYTKSETDALLNDKQDVIDIDNMLSSDLVDDTNSTNKFVTQADITNWNNKEDKSNKVTEINSSSTDTEYPSAKCVYDSQEEQNEHIAELEMLYNAFPTVSDEDTTIQLDNTAKVKFREIDLKGNTSQVVIPEEQGTSVSNTSIYVTDVDTDKENTIELSGNTYQANAILPSEYTQVDYIESSGTQYIDTGVNADNKLNVMLDMAFTSPTLNNQNIGAILLDGSATVRYHMLCDYSQNNNFRMYTNTNYVGVGTLDTNRHTFEFDCTNGKVYFDGTAYNKDTTNFDVGLNFWLFGRNSTSTKYYSNVKQYGCKMYYNNVLVRDFIPCYRNSDSEVGLYDLVNKVFYTNEGTGAFTYGSVASIPNPDYPQNIEVVTGTQNVTIANGDNTQSTTYPVNLGNIELCKTGDYQDRIYKQNDKWYIEKNIGKVTLNGSEHWTQAQYGYFADTNMFPNRDLLAYKGYCNYFIVNDNSTTWTNLYYCGWSAIGIFWIRDDYTLASTQVEFARWVSAHNLHIYYVLATPTTTEITDTSLVNQLNALYNATIYPITNINTDTNNLLPYIDLQYNVVTPAPSPSRPSVVNVVKGENTIIICGKNLCPTQESAWEQGNINTDGDVASTQSLRTKGYIPIKNDTNYHISVQDSTNYCYRNIRFYDKDLNQIGNMWSLDTSIDGATSKNINILSSSIPNLAFARIILRKQNNLTITTSEIEIAKPQLEKGSSSTTYKPYKSQAYPINLPSGMELCKISTYQDYFYKDNGNWYKHSEIGKVMVNGSEDWNRTSIGGYSRFELDGVDYLKGTAATTTPNFISNYLIAKNFTEVANGSAGVSWWWNVSRKLLIIGLGDDRTLSDFKTWLNTHNTTVYYPLATTTNTQITDTTLITQLNNIKKAYSYDTQTNISQTNEDKPFIIYAEAIRSLKDVFE